MASFCHCGTKENSRFPVIIASKATLDPKELEFTTVKTVAIYKSDHKDCFSFCFV